VSPDKEVKIMNNVNKVAIIGVIVLVILGFGGYLLSRNMNSTKVLGSTPQGTVITKSNVVPQQESQNSSTVQITANGYIPMDLTVKVGTTVTWINSSGTVVTVNSDNHPTHLLYSPLNLGKVNDGGSVSLRFDISGTYGYHNHLNPAQTGTITVQ
jgi:plastocyanin